MNLLNKRNSPFSHFMQGRKGLQELPQLYKDAHNLIYNSHFQFENLIFSKLHLKFQNISLVLSKFKILKKS